MLGVPPAAQRDDKAIEMLSAWIAEDGLHCSLKMGLWDGTETDSNAAWGILLADVVRHIANATQQEKGKPFDNTVEKILEAMNNELEDTTSDISGGKAVGLN